MDCKREFTVIQIQRLLLPVKWKEMDYISSLGWMF